MRYIARMNVRLQHAASLATIVLVAACSDAPSTTAPPEPGMPAAAHPPASPHGSASQLPPSHPPIAAMRPVTFTVPEGWKKVTPDNAMRREQYVLPGQGGDTEDAVLTVSVIPADQGGDVEMNLERWASQFTQPDGRKTREVMQHSSRTIGELHVIETDISGTYVASVTMGGVETHNEPGWRQLLTWIKAPSGNYYVKVLGPAATVGHWEASFRQFVNSASVK